MNQEQLRSEFKRIITAETIQGHSELLDIFIHCFFDMVINEPKPNDIIEDDARIMLQMITSKLLHLKKMYEGVGYINKARIKLLDGLIDPTVIAVLTRNLYETICAFHIIFINTKTADEKKIVYNLWVISGLEYRQRFKENITLEKHQQKAEIERQSIADLKLGIEKTNLFNHLNEKNKEKVYTAIKNKDYKIRFSKGQVEILSWADISKILFIEERVIKQMYNYFSLYSHPSNVSVFQYKDMFDLNGEVNKETASFILRFCLMLSSIFLGDFIRVFPSMLPVFEENSDLNQILIGMLRCN